MDSITVMNLETGDTMLFGGNATPEFAVVYAHLSEPQFHQGNMTSWLLTLKDQPERWMHFVNESPSGKTVRAGDWVALK
jgi:hypothetical protein